MVVRTALNLVALFARVSAPVIPFAAEEHRRWRWASRSPPTWPAADAAAELSRLEPGRPVQAPEVLFRKIDDAQIAEWTAAVRRGRTGRGGGGPGPYLRPRVLGDLARLDVEPVGREGVVLGRLRAGR